jgi:3-methyl-2-oxobutanoate hydroxymethyltransferase
MSKQKITLPLLRQKKERGEKIVTITCYDYPSARLMDEVGADIFLVGDSLGNTVLGYETTLPVTLDEILHHAKAVRRGTKNALLLADLPFLTYQVSPEEAVRNAGRLLKEAGVEAVKIEGGEEMVPTVVRLVQAGIPVMGHIGLTPQHIHALGGHRIQGKTEDGADRLFAQAKALAEAGVFAIVLELIPANLARRITEGVSVPTIGIGAGPHCDGQVQVFHDLFGLFPECAFRHSRRYAEAGMAIREGAARFVEEVRQNRFPTDEHSF